MNLSLLIILSILLSIGGFIISKDAKSSTIKSNKNLGLIMFYGGIYLLIIGLAYSFLHNNAWSDDNKQLFLHILNTLSVLYATLMAILLVLRSKKDNNKKAFFIYSGLGVLSIVIFSVMYSKIDAMNDGWTEEKQFRFLSKCTQEECSDCYCKLVNTMNYFPNPDDYNEAISNIELVEKYNLHIEAKCNVCNEKFLKDRSQDVPDF